MVNMVYIKHLIFFWDFIFFFYSSSFETMLFFKITSSLTVL